MSGPLHRSVEVGDAILLFLTPMDVELSLVHRRRVWSLLDPTGILPPNPYINCPAILLRDYSGTLAPGGPVGGLRHAVTYTYSIIYLLQQTLNADHNRVVAVDVDKIWDLFTLARLDPTAIIAVPGFLPRRVYPANRTIHQSLAHEFSDPRLRVSVGELQIIVEGDISSC